jgi:hypothetical protein
VYVHYFAGCDVVTFPSALQARDASVITILNVPSFPMSAANRLTRRSFVWLFYGLLLSSSKITGFHWSFYTFTRIAEALN